jgi:hypothetical protein
MSILNAHVAHCSILLYLLQFNSSFIQNSLLFTDEKQNILNILYAHNSKCRHSLILFTSTMRAAKLEEV